MLRDRVLQPWSQNIEPPSPLSQPVAAAKLVLQWVGSSAAGTTAPRNRVCKRATQPAKIFSSLQALQKQNQKPQHREHREIPQRKAEKFHCALDMELTPLRSLGIFSVSSVLSSSAGRAETA